MCLRPRNALVTKVQEMKENFFKCSDSSQYKNTNTDYRFSTDELLCPGDGGHFSLVPADAAGPEGRAEGQGQQGPGLKGF